jgi:hypothetical protein
MAEFTKFRPKYDQTGNVTGEYDELRRQHNIMCLIGNGFDRAILRREEFRNLIGLSGRSTSYRDFYYFISGNNKYNVPLLNEENLIYAKMKDDIENHPDDEIDT